MVIIADDLTGANDSAVQFKKKGLSSFVKVLFDQDAPNDIAESYDVLAINTDSRPLSSKEAYERVLKATRLAVPGDPSKIYKKIDSVLRGNPDAELEATMDAASCDLAFVVPSFPDNGRSVVDGVLTVDDRKIDAVGLFAKGMRRKVVGVALADVRSGAERLAAKIVSARAEGGSVFVFDAETDADIAAIRDCALKIPESAILCGSAGLAKFLVVGEKSRSAGSRRALSLGGKPILIAIGSRHESTATQIKNAVSFFSIPLVTLESARVLSGDGAGAADAVFSAACAHFESSSPILIVAVDTLFGKYTPVLRETEKDYEDARLLVEALSAVVVRMFSSFSIGAIVSSGGDTSLEICRAFGVSGIDLEDEIAPGIPAGTLIGGRADGTAIVTKSGGFGSPDAMIQIIEYLQRKGVSQK